MKKFKINLILMLTSGIIVGIIGIYFSYPLEKLMSTLLATLIIFYILGTVLDVLAHRLIASVEDEGDSATRGNDDEGLGIDSEDEDMGDLDELEGDDIDGDTIDDFSDNDSDLPMTDSDEDYYEVDDFDDVDLVSGDDL